MGSDKMMPLGDKVSVLPSYSNNYFPAFLVRNSIFGLTLRFTMVSSQCTKYKHAIKIWLNGLLKSNEQRLCLGTICLTILASYDFS